MSSPFKSLPIYPVISDLPPFTLNVPNCELVEGEGIPRRNAQHVDQLLTQPMEGINTVFDIVTRAARTFGDIRAVGSRRLIKTHNEFKKVRKIVNGREQEFDKNWTYFELSEYSYLSFSEYESLVLKTGSGLRNLGFIEDDRAFIFAATSANWLASAHGAASQSMPIVTAYDTLGDEAIRHSLLATQPKVIFTDPQLIGTLCKILEGAKSVEAIVYNDDQETKPSDIIQLKNLHDHLQVLSFKELTELGGKNMVDPVPPQPDDLCCIMYTSGSTGTPKGVLLTHRNIVSTVGGIDSVVGKYIGPEDTLIAYLPLAHIFEFVLENTAMFWGTLLGYGSSKTLSDQSMKNCKGDIRELRPTLMVGVPAVWEGIRKGIVGRVEKQGFVARCAFWGAFAAKSWLLKMGLPGYSMWDRAVFAAVKDATGGRIRMCANGAGPISKETQRFISLVMAPMILGYGMTETSGMGALGAPMRWTDEAIGDIPASIEVKLVDFPEAGYFSRANPPQGEIWIRGNSVTKGYYQNDHETASAITADGWLKTGDIGEWNRNGHLRVIDRKKNLVKTLNGEYIALEKLESIYRSSPLVSNICIYASPEHTKPIAIIIPDPLSLKDLAATNSIPNNADVKELIGNDKLRGLILGEIQAAGRRGGLSGMEIVGGVVLVDGEWTPQNGLLTSALKLFRRGIVKEYEDDIKAAYARFEGL